MQLGYPANNLPGKAMRSTKVRIVLKSATIKSSLKSTNNKSKEPTHQRKPRAMNKNFKTTERSRLYSRAYQWKITQLKHVGGHTPEKAKELARTYATTVLIQNGFAVQAMVSPELFSEAQSGDHVVLLHVVAEDPRTKTLCRLVQYRDSR